MRNIIKRILLEETDKIPGGLADDMDIPGLAKKHGVSIKDTLKHMLQGMDVEGEHTSDDSIAYEISKDHVYEDPKYYDKLDKIEGGYDSDESDDVVENLVMKISEAKKKKKKKKKKSKKKKTGYSKYHHMPYYGYGSTLDADSGDFGDFGSGGDGGGFGGGDGGGGGE